MRPLAGAGRPGSVASSPGSSRGQARSTVKRGGEGDRMEAEPWRGLKAVVTAHSVPGEGKANIDPVWDGLGRL